MAGDMNDAESDISDLKSMYFDAAYGSDTAREESERARDYYNGAQWTAAEVAILKKRGQPYDPFNRIRRKIDYICGAEQQARTDPKAYPRTPQHEQDAEAATDALRFVAEKQQLDEVFSDIFQDMLVEGYGGLEVEVAENKKGDTEIKVQRYAWDRLFYDPHSVRHDFSDANFIGAVVWMSLDRAKMLYPDVADEIETTSHNETPAETYEDKPHHQFYHVTGQRARVKIVKIWYRREGEWHWCEFTGGLKLKGGPSPFVDSDGESVCPMILQSAYIDRESNGRHGIVRDMIGPQNEINKRRSKFLHLSSVRQTYGTKGTVESPAAVKRELARADGHIEINGRWGENFGVLPTVDMGAAHFNLLQEAKNEIDLMGPNAAMQGKGDQDASGRAILAQQQGGMVELTPLLNRLRSLKLRTFRVIWDLIRQYWTEEKWIRVTDDESNVRFVGINRPVTVAEATLKTLEAEGANPAELQQVERELVADPRYQQVAAIENPVSELDVDIIIDEATDFVTLQQEQFTQLANLAQSGVPIPPDVLIKASALRNKDELLEMLQQQNPMAEIEMAKAQAEIEGKQAKAMKDAADAQKTQAEAAMAAATGYPV